jgi:hypothetical protein
VQAEAVLNEQDLTDTAIYHNSAELANDVPCEALTPSQVGVCQERRSSFDLRILYTSLRWLRNQPGDDRRHTFLD